MQLKVVILFILAGCFVSHGQDSTSSKLEPVEINFLSNYYAQNGDHSPVGGGLGSEKLSNITELIVINIPVKKGFQIEVEGEVEFFTSASQNFVSTSNSGGRAAADDDDDEEEDDDDDDDYFSGASRAKPPKSVITLGSVGFSKELEKRNADIGLHTGFYRDENAVSWSVSSDWSRSTKDNNNTFSAKASYFLDQWNLKDPGEIILGNEHLGDGRRHSVNLSLSYSRVMNKRLTGAIVADIGYQKGLLSTPYHKVYFSDSDIAALEKLPVSRIKFPVAMRLNYHATDFMLFRAYYRFYHDTWGITANTASLEIPLKVTPWLRMYPFYRFHHQSGAEYFAPFSTLTTTSQEFYTADHDLAPLNTHKAGIGFSVTPINGVFRTKNESHPGRSFMLKSIDLRYAYYMRSDGLDGHMVTGGLNFNIFRKD